MTWTFYPAFIGTLLSVSGLSWLVYRYYDRSKHRTLSEIAVSTPESTTYFRAVLWICVGFFAVTTFLYIGPRISGGALQTATWYTVFFTEILLGVFPAKGTWQLVIHNVLSTVMGFAMWLVATLFAFNLSGVFAHVEFVIAIAMFILGAMTVINRRNFLFYEMPFIFLSHVSILVAAIGVR